MMNMQLLRYAVEVDRCGSITRAAAKLDMGQPNLSKAIRDLENQLGIHIFRRTSRGVTTTTEGEELLTYARQVVTQVERIESLYENEPGMHVRFCLSSTPSLYVSEAFSRFCALSDDSDIMHMNLKLRELNRLAVIEDVCSGESDAGILRCRTDEEKMILEIASRRDLDVQPLWYYEMHIAMHKDHPLAGEERIPQEMLAPYMRVSIENTPAEHVYLFESELNMPSGENNWISVTSRHSAESIMVSRKDAYCAAPPIHSISMRHLNIVLRPAEGQVCRYRDLIITRRGGFNTPLTKALLGHLYDMQGQI